MQTMREDAETILREAVAAAQPGPARAGGAGSGAADGQDRAPCGGKGGVGHGTGRLCLCACLAGDCHYQGRPSRRGTPAARAGGGRAPCAGCAGLCCGAPCAGAHAGADGGGHGPCAAVRRSQRPVRAAARAGGAPAGDHAAAPAQRGGYRGDERRAQASFRREGRPLCAALRPGARCIHPAVGRAGRPGRTSSAPVPPCRIPRRAERRWRPPRRRACCRMPRWRPCSGRRRPSCWKTPAGMWSAACGCCAPRQKRRAAGSAMRRSC